jgi:hypothetical protein
MQSLNEVTVLAVKRVESASGPDPVSTKMRGSATTTAGRADPRPGTPMLVIAPLGFCPPRSY